jgi:hypothetical protein
MREPKPSGLDAANLLLESEPKRVFGVLVQKLYQVMEDQGLQEVRLFATGEVRIRKETSFFVDPI